MTEFVTREMLISKRYQVDFKEIKCFLQWWTKHETMFPTIGFLVCQIFRIVGSQIEIKRIFSYKLEEMSLTIKKFRKIDIGKQKNWPNNPKIDCKPPSNLVELIGKDSF
jgi:hypothetical protein